MKGDTMNLDPVYQKLREIGWRRELTEAEQIELRAWLLSHPDARADVEADAVLSRTLAKLPDAPMPSNFTARVLREIEREAVTAERTMAKSPAPLWRGLIPRIAVAAVVVGVSAVAYRHHQAEKQAELEATVKNLAAVADTTPLPDLTALEDFEAIRRLSQADDGLLALSEDLMSLKQ